VERLSSKPPTTPGLALTVRHLSKTYGDIRVLSDVSLEVQVGHVHSLVGGNGSGKSTLVKILAGVVSADPGGEVVVQSVHLDADQLSPSAARGLNLHFVHQDPGLFLDMSVTENLLIDRNFGVGIVSRVHWAASHRRAAEILERFDIPARPQQLMGELKPAARTMVAIARALQDQEDDHSAVLILDEPTAALSIGEVDTLLAALRRYASMGQTILFVSHRLDEVLSVSEDVSVLRDGRHLITRPTAQMTAKDLSELIVGRELSEPADRQGAATGKVMLELQGLQSGQLHNIDLVAREGEVVGIAGLIGAGRTRLLTTVFGLTPARAGTVRIEGRDVRVHDPSVAMACRFVYLPEDRSAHAAFADMSVAANMSISNLPDFVHWGWLSWQAEYRAAEESVTQFGIRLPSVRSSVSKLSGGNQQKVMLARLLQCRPRVLLLDEPSQGVDVGSRSDIHGIIRRTVRAGATALVVSSDLEELALLCDRVVVLFRGRIVGEMVGDQIYPVAIMNLMYGPEEDAS
jgi:ribose transport system ATP-binding protein